MNDRNVVVWMIAYIISACVIALVFCGCKTKVVTVEKVRTDTKYVTKLQRKVRTDTKYVTKLQRDSIHIHDSIFVNQWQKGDTVYQVRDRWHVMWRDRLLHDTIYKSIVDSVPVPYPVEKIVEKPVTPWHNYLIIGCLFLTILYLIFKRIIE